MASGCDRGGRDPRRSKRSGNGDWKEEFRKANDGKDDVRVPIEARLDMKDNFLAVLRGDGALHCNVDLGDAATMVAIKLAVESDRHSKTMRWDIEREKLVSGRGYLWRPWRC